MAVRQQSPQNTKTATATSRARFAARIPSPVNTAAGGNLWDRVISQIALSTVTKKKRSKNRALHLRRSSRTGDAAGTGSSSVRFVLLPRIHICTLTYLDLVPAVLFGTSSDELSPSGTIIHNWFGIIPVGFHFCQIFFKCLTASLSRSSRFYCHLHASTPSQYLLSDLSRNVYEGIQSCPKI